MISSIHLDHFIRKNIDRTSPAEAPMHVKLHLAVYITYTVTRLDLCRLSFILSTKVTCMYIYIDLCYLSFQACRVK